MLFIHIPLILLIIFLIIVNPSHNPDCKTTSSNFHQPQQQSFQSPQRVTTSDPDSCPVSRCLIHMYTELLLQLRNILIIQLNFTHKMGFLSFRYIHNHLPSQNFSSKALSQSPVLLCFLNFYYRDHCCYNAVCDLGPQRSSASPRHHVYLF